MMPTRLFERLQDRVHNLGAIAFAIDTSADVFGGRRKPRSRFANSSACFAVFHSRKMRP